MIVISPRNTLLLPGWQNSGPDHWQSRWEALHGYHRVEQHDWMRPLRGDWSARLEETVADADGPVLLVAHSLGCILTAWWAAHTRHAAKVRGALLVAPGDVERADLRQQLHGLGARARQAAAVSPFDAGGQPTTRIGAFERAEALARQWAARCWIIGARGHINAESGLGDWPEGHLLACKT
jgi:predicted alpha/beta hydrolase family esterase